ncbi:hypothetical protein NSQ43_04040 [Sporosarcina sp. FSL W8-0480]
MRVGDKPSKVGGKQPRVGDNSRKTVKTYLPEDAARYSWDAV